MAIQAKSYANKKAENGNNRVTVMMSVEEAAQIAAKDKAAVGELLSKISAIPEVKALAK